MGPWCTCCTQPGAAVLKQRKSMTSLFDDRTSTDRGVFQNRQEVVDRFGSLLQDYQRAKGQLQQQFDRALRDLR